MLKYSESVVNPENVKTKYKFFFYVSLYGLFSTKQPEISNKGKKKKKYPLKYKYYNTYAPKPPKTCQNL